MLIYLLVAKKPKPSAEPEPAEKPRKTENNEGSAQAMKKYEKGDNAMLDETIDISNDTVKELENIRKLNENTLEVGTEAAARLKAQTEKMKKIKGTCNGIGK